LLWSQYHQQLDEYQRQIQTIRESQPPVVDTSEVLLPPLPPVIALPSEPTVLSLEARLRELHHERMTMDLLLETSVPYERAEIHRDLSPHVSAPVLSRVTSATARACEIVDRQRIATLLAIEQAQAPRLLAASLKAAAAAHVTPIVPTKASPAPLAVAAAVAPLAAAAPAVPTDQPVPAPGPGNPPSKKERPQMAPSQNMQPPLAAIATEKPKTYVTCCPANCMFPGFYFVFVLLFSLLLFSFCSVGVIEAKRVSVRPAELHFLKSEPVVATTVTLLPKIVAELSQTAPSNDTASKTPTGQQNTSSSDFLESLPRFVFHHNFP
jgi:hypothetical protein